jgi:hypothetical protein
MRAFAHACGAYELAYATYERRQCGEHTHLCASMPPTYIYISAYLRTYETHALKEAVRRADACIYVSVPIEGYMNLAS